MFFTQHILQLYSCLGPAVPNAGTPQALLHSTRAQPEQTWIKAEQPVLSSVEVSVEG